MCMRLRKTLRRSDQRGFSLVEVLIAMGVLATGLLALAQIVPLALVGVSQAQVRTNAIEAAQERMDDLKSIDFDATALTAGTYTQTLGDYSLAWTITDNDPLTNCKRIVMTASWQTIRGTQNATLTTFVPRQE